MAQQAEWEFCHSPLSTARTSLLGAVALKESDRLKQLLFSSVVLSAIVVAGSAFGGDLPYKGPAAPTPIPTPSWTGFYVGVTAGYQWSNVSTWDLDVRSGLLGGHIGYNYQISNLGNFVVGIERDGAWTDLFQSNSNAPGIPAGSAAALIYGLTSLRGRAGAAFGNVLVYGTAGGGWGQSKASSTVLGITVSSDPWHSGWSAGAGVEWSFMTNLSAKIEYLHYDLGSMSYLGLGNSGNINADTLKVGLNYRFLVP
jgi:outer membrane immunogenic protein